MRHMSEYKGWEVAVTPREEALMFWRALIEIWPSGRDWRTSRPRLVSFRPQVGEGLGDLPSEDQRAESADAISVRDHLPGPPVV